ncbi:MAG TPA: hypothetical protein DHV62_09300, partial [Elusimicrobia bacterium]|nr:hypothetical protein [Elusimicrobiota bacterium]
PVNGNVDVLVINGDKKIAVEVETGKSDVIRNIEKCLKAGIDEIVIVAVTSHVKERIERDLRKRNSVADGKAKIILSSVHAWFA